MKYLYYLVPKSNNNNYLFNNIQNQNLKKM